MMYNEPFLQPLETIMLLNDFINFTRQLIDADVFKGIIRQNAIQNALKELCLAFEENRNVNAETFSPVFTYWHLRGLNENSISDPRDAWGALYDQLYHETILSAVLYPQMSTHLQNSTTYTVEFKKLWLDLLNREKPTNADFKKNPFYTLSFVTDLPTTKIVQWKSPLESVHSADKHSYFDATESEEEELPRQPISSNNHSAPIDDNYFKSGEGKLKTLLDLLSVTHDSSFAPPAESIGSTEHISHHSTEASASPYNNNNDNSTLNYNFIFNVAAAITAVNCIASLCIAALLLTSVITLSTAAMIGVGIGLGLSTVASAAVAGYSFFKSNNMPRQNHDFYSSDLPSAMEFNS